MALTKIKIPLRVSIPVLFGLVLVALQLMSSATQESSQLGEMYSLMLLINALGTVVLLVLFAINVFSLSRQLKKREAGSRLTTRMVSLFVILALAPATIVFYFSMQFLHRSIDSWFNVEIDRAMEDALELSQAALDQRMRWNLKQSLHAVENLRNKSGALATLELENMRVSVDASEMTLLSKHGRIKAFSSINPSEILPRISIDPIWLQLRQNQDYVGMDSLPDGELIIQTIVAVNSDEPQYLQVIFPIPVRTADLADSVEFAFIRFQEMSYLRDSFKVSFTLALLLVLLLSLLAAIWVAFISIRGIVAPVKELVKGTEAVASGHYEKQLSVTTQDDLGFLVESFNQMMNRIAAARDEIRHAGLEVENQRAYLETLLASLTSGVISFDAFHNIRTANQAANIILHLQVRRFYGKQLANLVDERADLAALVTSIQKMLEQEEDVWQQNMSIFGPNGRQELLYRWAPLYSPEGYRIGSVVVIDDITDLIQAQKNAAWGEVARRLAHEIKNPLTPIQLSAERLQLKLAGELDSKAADILQRSTRTIVQQVEAMKKMLDEFSEYARPAKKHAEIIDLSALVKEVLELYPVQANVRFKLAGAEQKNMINVDPVSIRQVLHNLLKNALEAVGDSGEIDVKLTSVDKNNAKFIELSIYDTGTGINSDKIEQIFEPYVTTKIKGTGLGLAIVKKIIEQHGGAIWVDTHYQKGAGFIIQLPAH
jgi:nitrogen fixation/metabolism regulation signal transduction histidine kinase